MLLASALAGMITWETFHPGYCPTGAIGYLRKAEFGMVVGGVTPKPSQGSSLIFWSPSNGQKVVIKWSDQSESEGSAWYRWHRGVLCAFEPKSSR